MINECKHEFMNAYVEAIELKETDRRPKYKSIWMCEAWGCGHKEDRERVEIWYSPKHPKENYHADTCDDIRILRILSSHLGITPKETLEKLKLAKEDNPIEYQGEFFWTESIEESNPLKQVCPMCHEDKHTGQCK